MNTEERRKQVLYMLKKANDPISASVIAKHLNVSRQIIVGDVALLRASGNTILATPKGYVFEDSNLKIFPYVGLLACNHHMGGLKDELYIIVDYGGTAIDVTVEHSIYGQLSGLLNISSRYDVDQFIQKVTTEGAKPLSNLTGGIHLHHIGCKDKQTFDIIKRKLTDIGIGM